MHAAAVPVPEHRRLADRQGRRPGRRRRRATTRAPSRTSTSGSRQGGDRDHHRRRAVAGLHQPGHGVRQLVVDGVDHGRARSFRRVWDTTADGTTRSPPLVTGEPTVETGLTQVSRVQPPVVGVGPVRRPHTRSTGKEARVLRYTSRRLLWAIPTLFIITFLVFLALRAGTDPVASYLRVNPRATPAKIQQYKEVNGLIGTPAGAVLPLAGPLPHRRLGQLHQGEPAGLAGDEERAGQHARARHRRHRRRHHDRPGHRHPGRAAALLQVRHRRHHRRLRRLLHPAVRVRRPPAAGLRGLHDEVARPVEAVPAHVGDLPTGPHGLRPRAAGQAPDPPGHRGGHPDHRRLQPLHARVSCMEVKNSDYMRTARSKGISRAARSSSSTRCATRSSRSSRSPPSTSAPSSAA